MLRGLWQKVLSLFGKGDGTFISLIVLLRSPLALSLDDVRAHLNTIFPGKFQELSDENDGADCSFVIDGVDGPTGEPSFFVKCIEPRHGGIFLIHNCSKRYTSPEAFNGQDVHPELVQSVKLHNAWLSVDPIDNIDSKEDADRFMRVVIAQFAPQDALAVLNPAVSGFVSYTEMLRRALAQGEDVFEDPETAP